MASKNVQTILAAYEAFNRRDLDGAVAPAVEDVIWEDHGRGVTFKSRAEYRDGLAEWANGFSDAKITEATAIDGGDTVVVQFVGRGTNDGTLAGMAATGRPVTLPFCDIVHFDAAGKIIRGASYYDMLTLLVQLGHAQMPPA